MKIILCFVGLLFWNSLVFAENFNYTSVELRYTNSEMDPSLDGDGFDFVLTHDFNQLLLNLRIQKLDYDLSGGFELYTESHFLGIGSNMSLSNSTDIYGFVHIGQYDEGINPTGPKGVSSDVTSLMLGLKHWVGQYLEAELFAGKQDYETGVDDQTYLGGKLIYYSSEERSFGLSATYENFDDIDNLHLGMTFNY